MAANLPQEIFTMNPDTLQDEFDEYAKQYQANEKYHEIRNFVATQQLKFLFKKAKELLSTTPPET